MRRIYFLLLCGLLFPVAAVAQVPADTGRVPPVDSVPREFPPPRVDSSMVAPVVDSVAKKPATDTARTGEPGDSALLPSFSWKIIRHHPYFGFNAEITVKPGSEKRQVQGKEWLFYVIITLLLLYALLRRAFPKYFGDLFRLFFRTTLKQRQVKEQLMQTPLPSVLLNGFFVLSAGLYLALVLQYFGLNPTESFWLLILYSCAGLSAIYLVKFLGLKLAGWLFSMEEAADSYIFIVFIINKMIGLLLLPFLVLLAFTTGNIHTAALTLSWCLVGGLLIYRFVLTYVAVRNQVKVNLFHFFLYLCAFEIAPLLLIYRGLLLFFRIST